MINILMSEGIPLGFDLVGECGNFYKLVFFKKMSSQETASLCKIFHKEKQEKKQEINSLSQSKFNSNFQ